MLAINVSGWMADFGESLPLDAKLYSGESPSSTHSRYPQMWAKINKEAIESYHQPRKLANNLWNVCMGNVYKTLVLIRVAAILLFTFVPVIFRYCAFIHL